MPSTRLSHCFSRLHDIVDSRASSSGALRQTWLRQQSGRLRGQHYAASVSIAAGNATVLVANNFILAIESSSTSQRQGMMRRRSTSPLSDE